MVSRFYSWKRPKDLTRILAPSHAPPIVILPGFGNCSSDYVAPFGLKEEGIAHFLQQRGFAVYVVDIERRDWLQVARCIASRAYWTGKSTVDPGYRWYLHRVQAAIDKACKECDSDQVDLIGHSAGGWLARAFVGDALYMKSSPEASSSPAAEPHVAPGLGVGRLPSRAHEGVRKLITLGTPHLGPSTGGRDMTGGTLTWLNTQWPGAFFKDQGIQYTCVAGQLVAGNKEAAHRSLSKYACNSYREVCGDGHGQLGDGVVPRCCAHLEGADNLLLDGVFHSISKKGTFADRSQLVWLEHHRALQLVWRFLPHSDGYNIVVPSFNLTGTLPNNWSRLTKVSFIDLSHNHFTGTLPPSWSNMIQFSLASLPQLLTLNLSSNGLNGSLPSSWSDSQMATISLDNNHPYQTLGPRLRMAYNFHLSPLRILSEQQKLTDIFLHDNELTGTLPASWFGKGPEGTLVVCIHKLKSEGALDQSNRLSVLPWPEGSILKHLTWQGNKLTGPLPPTLAEGSEPMWVINLEGNRLTGTLPSGWNSTNQLNFVGLASNRFTGSLPSSWSNLPLSGGSIEYLSLGSNNLTGTLPSSWSSFDTLQFLSLDNNTLHGPLPITWSNMYNLEYGNLASNAFTGSAPSTWASWHQVQYIRFDDNQLTGSRPSVANTTVFMNVTSNHISQWSHSALPNSIQVLYAANNSFRMVTSQIPACFQPA
ncbi:hypothetical protein WJX82_006141 [Trebouxia sp. C0006]